MFLHQQEVYMVHPHKNLLPNDISIHLWNPTNVTFSLYGVILHTYIPASYTLMFTP